MAETNPKVRTAVVLQGGGGLGAYEFGVLKALYAERPGFRPAVVSGTSIGAITASVLAGAKDDPISTLEWLWLQELAVTVPGLAAMTAWLPHAVQRSLAVWGNPGMYRLRPEIFFAPRQCTSVYDTTPLRETLAELVDLGKLNSGDPRVIVGGIDIGTGESTFFDTQERSMSFDHVVASGSLPPGFPMTQIDDRSYWDGGLFTNTPMAPAINALEECDDGDPSVVRELIVVELFPMRGTIPDTMPEVLDRMIQLQYTSRLTLDRKFFDKIGHLVDLMSEIDKQLPPGSALRKDPAYQEMIGHRKIDRFCVVTANFPPALSSASDFSPASIEARIEAGYHDAIAQGIGGSGAREPGTNDEGLAAARSAARRSAPSLPRGPE